jgi:hypothetical protein
MARTKTETDDRGHECAMEIAEDDSDLGTTIYIRFDGRRIAYRGKPNTPQAKTWVSMVPGYEVREVNDNVIEVYFEDKRLH